MSTKINDGGPAFPQAIVRSEDGQLGFSSDYGLGGISIRDYFAAKALQMIVINDTSGRPENFRQYYSEGAYMWADAMLKAREVKLC